MIVGLTGRSQHGKSAVAEILRDEHEFHVLAFADPMYKSAENVLGLGRDAWKALKNDPNARVVVYGPGMSGSDLHSNISVREFFQRYGSEGHRDVPEFGDRVWVDMVDHKIADLIAMGGADVNIVVSDVRMPNEVELIRAYGGIVVEVYRPQMATAKTVAGTTHATERSVDCDFTLWNGGDLDDLRKTVRFDILGVGGALRGVGESHRPAGRPLGDDRIG
jgi:hypothetical protein